MHQILIDEFDRHLAGEASPAFRAHLEGCAECRNQVTHFEQLTLALQGLRASPDTVPEPSLGFYNRVALRIVDEQKKEAWGLFSPGAAFFRRIAFASLLLLGALGSLLVSRESTQGGTDAVSIMASHDVSAAHSETPADRDRLLVTLATYRQ